MVPFSAVQSKQFLDTEQVAQALDDVRRRLASFNGRMGYKTVKGSDYLYRITDSKGNGKSLGRRSPQTDEILARFVSGKSALKERQKGLLSKLTEDARMNRALRINRAPRLVGEVCELLNAHRLLGYGITIIGTNCLYAYEGLGAVMFDSDILATTDSDLLWDTRRRLKLGFHEGAVQFDGIVGLLRQLDGSFAQVESQPHRAVNKDGFMVDLIRQQPSPPWKEEPDRFFASDLIATDIWDMKWLLSSPTIDQMVIAENGRPFSMTVPDPRAFVLFKYWLAASNARNPQKKGRDLLQAQAVEALLREHLPQFPLKWNSLRSFPKNAAASVSGMLESQPEAAATPQRRQSRTDG